MSTPPTNNITLKFQREINRISDSDRNTRKSGLKKLTENLPWSCTAPDEVESLRQTCTEVIFEPLLHTLIDQVEKCRELSIVLLTKIVNLYHNQLSYEMISKLVNVLCSRVNDTPFPEKGDVKSMSEVIIPAIGKALVDQFPDVKKACSEVLIEIGKLTTSDIIRAHYKILLKGLVVNASHQHYKVRSLTIKVSF